MTNRVVRLYALAATLVTFAVIWAVVAVRPWTAETAAATDPRVAQLERRAERLRERASEVQRILDRRFASYREELAKQQAEIAAVGQPSSPPPATAPAVRVVTLPPLTTTQTS